MIYRLLGNLNYLFYFFCIFIILLILTYIIYKIFIIDNDLFILNEKLNKIELELGNSSSFKSSNDKNQTFNLTDIIMNEVFNNDKKEKSYCNDNKCKIRINEKSLVKPEIKSEIKPEINEIDIDEVINIEPSIQQTEEPIFDLKKEVINNDNDSIISGGIQITKKKLLKLNVDNLREKCLELNLSPEGTKAQLVDRVYEELNKEV